MLQIIFTLPYKMAGVHSCIKIDPKPMEFKREDFDWLQLALKKIHKQNDFILFTIYRGERNLKSVDKCTLCLV